MEGGVIKHRIDAIAAQVRSQLSDAADVAAEELGGRISIMAAWGEGPDRRRQAVAIQLGDRSDAWIAKRAVSALSNWRRESLAA